MGGLFFEVFGLALVFGGGSVFFRWELFFKVRGD